MTTTYKQTLYRIQPPHNKNVVPLGLAHEIEKVLEEDTYLHIVKTSEHKGDFGHPVTDTMHLFYRRNHAFDVMQSVMRNLGLMEDGWDFEDADISENEDLEVDDTAEPEDDWCIVEETIYLNVQEM